MNFRRSLITVLIFLSAIFRLSAQEKGSQVDSLVRLLSAQSMELIEKNGLNYRKVTGPARFLHNDTYLICDTALWNVSSNEIYAIKNVKILQDQTVLTGGKLTYYVDRDLAEFRGSLVQLEDKDRNVLRTEYLDYNTRDSVAVFFNGGSMRDKDGQIIESRTGTYDSKLKTFTFTDDVNMFTDSIFVKSSSIIYDANRNMATFGYNTDTWSEDNMLSANAGWYDRNKEIFLFRKNVHGMSDTQEGWADSLFYYRSSGNIEMLGNAQVIDTTRDVSALAGKIYYTDTLSQIVLSRKPAVIGIVKEENAAPDTVYFGADTLIARTRMMFEIEDGLKKAAESRLKDLSVDAVQNYRQKAAKEAAEAAAKAAEEDPNRPKPQQKNQGKGKVNDNATAKPAGPSDKAKQADATKESEQPKQAEEIAAQKDTLATEAPESADTLALTKPSEPDAAAADSLGSAPADSTALTSEALKELADSVGVRADSLAAPKDSTKLNFITAIRNVKMYKSDIQFACDSLEYNDLDSLVRMYQKPVVWNETNRQYSSDSLYAVIKGSSLQKASLMSNAFIVVQEDSLCFDQIRATEMLAYFDEKGGLTRFDALGEANAIFYIPEDSVYATVNKSAAKMLYAQFKDGDLDKVYYFESAKNDAYPVAQMSKDDRVLKGFNWDPERRPAGRESITPLSLRASERDYYASRPRTTFTYTDKYYPGYIPGVMKEIERGRLAKSEAKARRRAAAQAKAAQDSLTVARDSASVDSLSMSPADSSSAVPALADSTKAGADSLSMSPDSSIVNASVTDPAVLKKAQRDSLRAAKIAAREAKWARLDSLDAAKAKAAADKKAAKLRAKKLKEILAAEARERKENARLDKYKASFAKQKEREDKRKARLSEKKALSDKKKDNSKKEKDPLNVPLRATGLKSSLDDVAVDDSTSEKVPPIEETDNIE